MGVHLGTSFRSVRELNIKKMERAILFKVLVIIAVLAVHIEAAGHEQNGGSRPSRPRPSRPSRPVQQPSTEMRQEVDQEHTHEEVEREQPMEASGPDHDGPDCPYKKKYKKKYGGYKKYDDYGYGGYKRNDDYGYGGYKQNDDYGYGGYKMYGGGYGSSYGQGYGGQKYGGGYGSYGASQYGGGYGVQKYSGQYGGGYGGQQYGGYNQRYQQYGQNAYGTYGNTVNYTAPNAYVQQAPPQFNYQDVINKGYKKAG